MTYFSAFCQTQVKLWQYCGHCTEKAFSIKFPSKVKLLVPRSGVDAPVRRRRDPAELAPQRDGRRRRRRDLVRAARHRQDQRVHAQERHLRTRNLRRQGHRVHKHILITITTFMIINSLMTP